MTSHEQKIGAVHAYVDAFATGSADAAAALFAQHCTVEDPVGAEKITGRDAVLAFYQRSMQTGATLSLQGDIRTAGNFAAFAFRATIPGSAVLTIDVIDTFEFDERGKIIAMRAFWGPQAMRKA
jgi:steroid delta-isomerase